MSVIRKKQQEPLHGSEGFVCVYFLCLFLMIISLVSTICTNENNQMQIMENTMQASEYLSCEAAVSSYVKCSLKNRKIPSGSVFYADCSFTFTASNGRHLTCRLTSPVSEIIQFEIDPDEYLLNDYQVIRSR